MKQQIAQLLTEILAQMGVVGVVPQVEIPEDATHGDYTTNVAMLVSKQLKKSPRVVAEEIVSELKSQNSMIKAKRGDQDTTQSGQKASGSGVKNSVLQDVDHVEVAGPGFINLFLSASALSTSLRSVLKKGQSYGTVQRSKIKDQRSKIQEKKRIMVEFTDPNPFKELHIGHLYSNSVGESICRLLASQGYEVKRADYFGDVGMHVAKSLWGMREQFKIQNAEFRIEEALQKLEKLPLPERVQWMGQAYALGSQTYEKDAAAAEEMKRLNKLIFIAAQDLQAAKTKRAPVVDYRKGEAIDEAELAEIQMLFATGRQWSLDYFETFYVRLGTKFDYYYPESEVAEYGAKLVLDHVGKVFEKSDGAIVYRGAPEAGLHTRVFINSLGLPTYEAKELGLNWKKHQDFPADRSLIVTGNEINEYFKVLLAAMTDVIPEVAAKTRHIGHGMVRLPEGKMSSRTGKVLTGGWLLSEAKAKVYDLLAKNISNYTKEQQEQIAEKAAVAAIKYSLLRVGLPANVAFDIEKSVNFDGDSGPYLQYTYARCRSVLRKAAEVPNSNYQKPNKHQISTTKNKKFVSLELDSLKIVWNLDFGTWNFNSEERSVARLISQFPDVVADAAQHLAPSAICRYLFDLAQAFNLFYQKHSILGDTDKTLVNQRLALAAATAQVLHNGLYLLGIETLEQM